MLAGTFYSEPYDVIFLSSVIESVYPIYKKNNSNIHVVYRAANDKDKELQFFDKYEYVGLTTPEEYKMFLLDTLERLSNKTTLCIILAATYPIKGGDKIIKRHGIMNKVVKEVASINSRLRYIDVNDFIKSSKDINGSINHYQSRVYYDIAMAMINVIKDVTGIKVQSKSKLFVIFNHILKKVKPIFIKSISHESNTYKFIRKIYYRLTGRHRKM